MIRMKPAALALFGLLAASGFAQIDPNRTLIIVNGEPIKGSQYYTRMEILPGVGKLVGSEFVAGTPGFLTLQTIINEILMVQLAKKEGVSPTEAEIDAEVARRDDLMPQIHKNFKLAGLTEADFRYDTMVQVAEFKILTKGINVTDFEVDAYYKNNPRKFLIPARLRLRVIAVANVAAQGPVDAALKAGESFESVAMKFSVDEVTKASGGLLGDVEPSDLGEATRDIVTKTKKGEMTTWIRGSSAFFKFKVDDIQDEKILPMDDKMRREIRRQIMLDKSITLLQMDAKMTEMRKTAKYEFMGTPFDDTLKKLYGVAG